MLFTIFYAKDCLIFLSGNEFIGATLAMQIIAPTILLIGLSNLLGIQVLTPLNKEKTISLFSCSRRFSRFNFKYYIYTQNGSGGSIAWNASS